MNLNINLISSRRFRFIALDLLQSSDDRYQLDQQQSYSIKCDINLLNSTSIRLLGLDLFPILCFGPSNPNRRPQIRQARNYIFLQEPIKDDGAVCEHLKKPTETQCSSTHTHATSAHQQTLRHTHSLNPRTPTRKR